MFAPDQTPSECCMSFHSLGVMELDVGVRRVPGEGGGHCRRGRGMLREQEEGNQDRRGDEVWPEVAGSKDSHASCTVHRAPCTGVSKGSRQGSTGQRAQKAASLSSVSAPPAARPASWKAARY